MHIAQYDGYDNVVYIGSSLLVKRVCSEKKKILIDYYIIIHKFVWFSKI